MKFFAAITVLAAVAVATPTPTDETPAAESSLAASQYRPTPLPFYLEGYAYKKIDQQRVNANGNKFWIGKPTRSYCPSKRYENTFNEPCPPGDSTEFLPFAPCYFNANNPPQTDEPSAGPIYLNSLGSFATFEAQKVFVDPTTGAMMFETPDLKAPAGAKETFTSILGTIRAVKKHNKYDYYSPKACPAKNSNFIDTYQIFFDIVDLPKNCVNITMNQGRQMPTFRYV